MVMNRGRGERHGAPDIVNLNPRAAEIVRSRQFGNYSDSTLLYHLRNKFMRVEQFTADGREQTSLFCLPRIVRDISDETTALTGYMAAGRPRDVVYSYGCLRILQSGSLR